MNDDAILELYWKRKEVAVSETEQKYTNYCFKIAWNILFSKEDSEECVNDTWLIAWNSIPPQRPKVLSSFLGKCTRNLAIDCLRKKGAGKRPNMHMLDIGGEVESLEKAIAYTIDEQIHEKEIIEIFNQFLQKLSVQNRDIFIRRYWYMDSVKDIAKRHASSESKIKSSLFHSRKKLLSILRKELYE